MSLLLMVHKEHQGNEISTTHRTIREYRLKDAPEDAYAEKAKSTPIFRLRFYPMQIRKRMNLLML